MSTPAANGRPGLTDDDLRRHIEYLRAELTANAVFSRSQFFKQLLDPRRNLDDECGYPAMASGIDVQTYQDFYEREPIAARVVQVLPYESWQVQPLVYEDEDADTTTPFEAAWDALGAALRGEQSHFRQEEGSPIWEYLRRADELSGIGSFGILLFGLDDGLDLAQPVQGVEERHSNPVEPTPDGAQYPNGPPRANYAFTVNLGEPDPTTGRRPGARRLLYLRVFPESLVQITQFESNPTSPRFGQPVMYSVTLSDPRAQTAGSWSGIPLATRQVHWTRVLHVADNLGSSEIFGTPRMRPVFNRLYDLRKTYGASGEGYYKGAFMGLSFESHPQLGGEVDINPTEFKQQLEQYQNGLQRYLFSTGMTAKTLPPQTVDPTPYINIHIEAICIQLGIPVRIFKGSERGELASGQDDATWNDRLRARQRNYLTPRLIVPFIDRLILYGVLPAPAQHGKGKRKAGTPEGVGYVVEWPDLDTQDEAQQADVAVKRTTALATYIQANGAAVIPELDFLTRVLGFSEEEGQAILTAALKASGDEAEGEARSPLLGTVGGMTGAIDLFKAAAEGAISEEQLRQLLMLFFKVGEAQADRIIADGLTATAAEAGMGLEAEVEKDRTLIDEGLKADPLEKQPPAPIKVKAGEKLVTPPAANVFCPTGPGGGVDATCRPKGKAAGKASARQRRREEKARRKEAAKQKAQAAQPSTPSAVPAPSPAESPKSKLARAKEKVKAALGVLGEGGKVLAKSAAGAAVSLVQGVVADYVAQAKTGTWPLLVTRAVGTVEHFLASRAVTELGGPDAGTAQMSVSVASWAVAKALVAIKNRRKGGTMNEQRPVGNETGEEQDQETLALARRLLTALAEATGGAFVVPSEDELRASLSVERDTAWLDGLDELDAGAIGDEVLGELDEPTENAFCATGRGGGIDPTCSPKGGGKKKC